MLIQPLSADTPLARFPFPPQAMIDREYEELKELLEQHSLLQEGTFKLSSQQESNYYYDVKKVSRSPRGTVLIGQVLFRILHELKVDAVGGLAIGADPIATAVAFVSELKGNPIPAFIVRERQKEHGLREKVAESYSPDGKKLLGPGRRVAIVDDVVTTGSSVRKALDQVEALGCEVVAIVVVIDRSEADGSRKLRKNYNFIALFKTSADGSLIPALPVSAQ